MIIHQLIQIQLKMKLNLTQQIKKLYLAPLMQKPMSLVLIQLTMNQSAIIQIGLTQIQQKMLLQSVMKKLIMLMVVPLM